jgi:hypothetical protein
MQTTLTRTADGYLSYDGRNYHFYGKTNIKSNIS